MLHSIEAEIAQEDVMFNDNIPAARHSDFYHSRDVYDSHIPQPSAGSYAAAESSYTVSAGIYQEEPMALPQGSASQRHRLSDDAESEAPSPESLMSSPRSGATTPRTASRPATPRERVQQQIMLNQQKRRLGRHACSIQSPKSMDVCNVTSQARTARSLQTAPPAHLAGPHTMRAMILSISRSQKMSICTGSPSVQGVAQRGAQGVAQRGKVILSRPC